MNNNTNTSNNTNNNNTNNTNQDEHHYSAKEMGKDVMKTVVVTSTAIMTLLCCLTGE